MLRSILRRTLPCCLLLLLLPGLAAATTRYVNPDGLCGASTPCYPDLQSAINASIPGDLIEVQAALYPLISTVLVDRPVEIYGPQAGVNPLPSRGSTRVPGSAAEAILDGGGTLGTLIRILADGVLLDGFEVRNGTGDLIESVAATPTRGTRLRNNIIHDSSGDEGVQLRATADAVIECNYSYSTVGDGLNLCCGSTDGVVRFNEVGNCASENAAIYVYGASNTRIEGNLVHHTTRNEGIKLGSKDGADAALVGGLVRGNTTHDTAQDGIAVYMSHTAVSCNEVSASASENGGIYLAWAISDLSVTDNYVHDNSFNTGKWGDPAGIMIGADPDAATITVSGNRLANNLPNGITNKAAAPLLAGNNWWGAAGGPGPVGPGSGDHVSANVSYAPWLLAAPAPSCPPVGSCDGGLPTRTPVSTWGGIKAIYR
jgi:hypothetical protein